MSVDVYRDGDYQILKIGALGPYNNNAYILSDLSARESLIVDMPEGSQPVLDALGELKVTSIVATHFHRDHWADYELVRGATGAPVFVHEAEINVPPERIDGRLRHGQEIAIGGMRARVLHTPGHTPGSICLQVGKVLISGDTLFNGGPGRTGANEDLQTELRAIADHLLGLAGETLVWPGHGENTTIAASVEGFNAFNSKTHPPDLKGDVTWTES